MKRSHEVPPLRVGAHIESDKSGHSHLEWSRITNLDETVDIAFPNERAGNLLKRLKRWIDTRIGAYEDEIRMLRRLHRTDRLEIVMTGGNDDSNQFEAVLQEYWRTRQTRHYRRMIIAGVAVLPALVLTVLPGPNIVGIPLAYLAWHHWRIVRGLNKVRSGAIEVALKVAPRVISNHPTGESGHDIGQSSAQESYETSDVQHP